MNLFNPQCLSSLLYQRFDADLPDDSPDNYYLEREWRKHGNLKFTPADVVRVIVASGFEDRLRSDVPAFGELVRGL